MCPQLPLSYRRGKYAVIRSGEKRKEMADGGAVHKLTQFFRSRGKGEENAGRKGGRKKRRKMTGLPPLSIALA